MLPSNSDSLSELGNRLLGNVHMHLDDLLSRFSYLLKLALQNCRVHPRQLSFVDYGGGLGLLSALAKGAGIGTVMYVDIYETICRDAAVFHRMLDMPADHYIKGGIDELVGFVGKTGLRVDSLVSYDVIEHIYDIEDFLRNVVSLSPHPYAVVLGSGANPHNPRTRLRLMRNALLTEYVDMEKQWGKELRDNVRAYYTLRKEIVSQFAPGLSQTEVRRLAKQTRGLIKKDILMVVSEYLRTGSSRYKPDHPTNTCCPYTGYWAERLHDVRYLARVLRSAGCKVSVLSGYYPSNYKSGFKREIARAINRFHTRFPHNLFLAPYFILSARTGGSRSS